MRVIGEIWSNGRDRFIWTGTLWSKIAENHPVLIPSTEDLEKYPALKIAWEQYLYTRKLLSL